MKTVTIHEAKTHLSRLVKEAVAGEEIVIARGRQPMVRLVALAQAKQPRVFGSAEGLFEMTSDFDEPLTDFDGYR